MTLSAPREPQVSPSVYKSLGLQALLDRVQHDQSYSILDLGPALEANVRFWSEFSCLLYIYDFYRSFREMKAAVGAAEDFEKSVFSGLLAFSADTVFDIILAWDLFNYLDLRELEVIVQMLSRWCRRGTRLFALVSHRPKISVSPMMFRILNREQLAYEIPDRLSRPCPRHSPRDIARMMGRFIISRSFQSRHGIQEYVFAFE
jgi:hypothetical protein